MMRSLWARVTGKDKRKTYPEQQISALDRVGNAIFIFPYGLYTDLPDDAFSRVIDDGVALPATVKRPSDTKRGEPVIFHPETNSRIIFRNDGSIEVNTGSSPVNINSALVHITGDLEVDGDITTLHHSPNAVKLSTHIHEQGNDGDGDSEVDTDPPTAGS